MVEGCHAGVENIHYGGPRLRCVDCHLGDPEATTKAAAHVTVDTSFNPSSPGSDVRANPSLAELDALDPKVLQFLNPADYRVAMQTCGSSVLGGGNCHASVTETSLQLNRATLSGTLAGGGFMAGTQDKDARFAIVPTTDPYTPESLPLDVLRSLSRLPGSAPDDVDDPVAKAFFPVFEQLCTECHLNQDGRHEPGLYYSSGCNGCHMKSAQDARARTGDETQDRDELGHVESHRFTNLIPDSQCAHCHVSHLGRSMLAIGVRERSEPEGDKDIERPNRGVEDPEHHVPWGSENYVRHQGGLWVYGKPYPFYIEDEDGSNAVDETPPDVHTEAGLGCIDCHNIREAHGDKKMAARMDQELDVRCESCHGRPGQKGRLLSDAGVAFARSGTSVGASGENQGVFEKADGLVRQRGRFTGLLHPVTQITGPTDPTDAAFNPNTRMGCELHAGTAARRKALKAEVNALAASDPGSVGMAFPGLPAGFTFTEPPQDGAPGDEVDGRVECFACHNTWTVNCYGCHIVRDDRERYTSHLDGLEKSGKVSTFGMSVLADALALGFNAKGKITPMIGTSIFFTHIDGDGKRVIDSAPLVTGEGLSGDGNLHNPAHHHTVRKLARDCDGCHPRQDDLHDPAALLRATGLGTGEYTFTDGEGRVHWLDKLVRVDLNGDGVWDDPEPGVLPAEVDAVDRIVGTTHRTLSPDRAQAGPLDRAAINGMLKNRVVPQRPPPAPETPNPGE